MFASALLVVLLVSQETAVGRPPAVLTVGPRSFATWEEFLTAPEFRSEGWRCGTRLEALPIVSTGPSDCGEASSTIRLAYEAAEHRVFRIPVVVHVLIASTGQGNLPDARIRDQIEVLNEDFRALGGTRGAGGTDTRIEFFLATTDPGGNPSTGITRSVNDAWFQDGGGYFDALAWDPSRYLNLYTNNASGALGYVPDLPHSGLVGTNRDRVVLLWAAVGRNAPIGPPYDLGRTATHEVGHYLGLFHTFQDGCGSADCYASGDRLCDTAAEAAPVFGCPTSSSTCGASDPFHNYMDYSDDACYEEFTPEQANRMRCTLAHWRPGLDATCSSAASAVRGAGSNEDVLSATRPVLGGPLVFNLAASSGRTSGLLFAFARPTVRVLRQGGVLLVDERSPRFLFLAVTPGTAVTLDLPRLSTLCGLSLHAQGAVFGGLPWSLTNAVDLTLGL